MVLCEKCIHYPICIVAAGMTDKFKLPREGEAWACELFESAEMVKPLELKDTVEGMLSDDYKERFKAEYQQTKIRYEKLKTFCNKIEAAVETKNMAKGFPMPKFDCPYGVLRDQQSAMGEYLHVLEIRAVIEGIEL